MTVNEKIIAALSPTGYTIMPDVKTAEDQTYYTFNYTTLGTNFGDDAPQDERYLVQVHFFCPDNFDSVDLRSQTKQLLFGAGFTFPNVVDASDQDGQHWVFECEILEGV